MHNARNDLSLRLANVSRLSEGVFAHAKLRKDTALLAFAHNIAISEETELPRFVDRKYNRQFLETYLAEHASTRYIETLLLPPANANFVLSYLAILSYIFHFQFVVRAGPGTRFFSDLIQSCLDCERARGDLAGAISAISYNYRDSSELQLLSKKFSRVMVWGGAEKVEQATELFSGVNVLAFPPRVSAALIPTSITGLNLVDSVSDQKPLRRLVRDTFSDGNTLCSSPKYWIFRRSADQDILNFLSGLSLQVGWRQPVKQYSQLLDVNAEMWHLLAREKERVKWLFRYGPFYFIKFYKGERIYTPPGIVQCVAEDEWLEISAQYESHLQTLLVPEGKDCDFQTMSANFGRCVAYGQALVFNTTWDGKDIVQWACKK